MGFAVIQGYGLTETAPIVTLNHPFKTGKEVGRHADRGRRDPHRRRRRDPRARRERHERVLRQTRTRSRRRRRLDADGWLHTGDIGERDEQGRLFIKGRKKEMIVTPEGLNVFPEDVERVLNELAGRARVGGRRRDERAARNACTRCWCSSRASTGTRSCGTPTRGCRITSAFAARRSGRPATLPRTEGTRKLKRAAIREWVAAGGQPLATAGGDTLEALIARFARGRDVSGDTTLEELGLSSLERVELMVALEDRFQTRIDEGALRGGAQRRRSQAAASSSDRRPRSTRTSRSTSRRGTARWPVRLVRRLSLATWILPLARVFAHVRVEGREHLRRLDGPVIFASNHQSHMDVPVILAALPGRWRARRGAGHGEGVLQGALLPARPLVAAVVHELAELLPRGFYFNAFPLPQREAGARQTLQYIGELTGEGLVDPDLSRGRARRDRATSSRSAAASA